MGAIFTAMQITPKLLLRANLEYGEEVCQLVKNFNPKQGYLRQWLIWWTRWKKQLKGPP